MYKCLAKLQPSSPSTFFHGSQSFQDHGPKDFFDPLASENTRALNLAFVQNYPMLLKETLQKDWSFKASPSELTLLQYVNDHHLVATDSATCLWSTLENYSSFSRFWGTLSPGRKLNHDRWKYPTWSTNSLEIRGHAYYGLEWSYPSDFHINRPKIIMQLSGGSKILPTLNLGLGWNTGPLYSTTSGDQLLKKTDIKEKAFQWTWL